MKSLAVLGAVALAGCCCARTTCCPQPGPEPVSPTRVAAPIPPKPASCADLPNDVPFELADDSLRGGDEIKIVGVRGDLDTLTSGGRYCVWGIYDLRTRPSATLCVWSTDGDTEAQESDRCVSVGRGKGEFAFRFRVKERLGRLHVMFDPIEGGGSFGGVYFVNPKRDFGVGEISDAEQAWLEEIYQLNRRLQYCLFTASHETDKEKQEKSKAACIEQFKANMRAAQAAYERSQAAHGK